MSGELTLETSRRPQVTRACARCGSTPGPEDVYCAACGLPAGRIAWSISADRASGAGPVRIQEGGAFYLVAENPGTAPVTVEVDPSTFTGLEVEAPLSRRVSPGQVQPFAVRHVPGQAPGGAFRVRSDEGPRENWWERRSWREARLDISKLVQVRSEAWVLGTEELWFPPGVTRQYLRVWNDSELPRRFHSSTPTGCKVIALNVGDGPDPLLLPPGGALSLAVDLLAPPATGALEWRAGPDEATVALRVDAAPAAVTGPDVVLAIDFGTRNTGMRCRWRRTIFTSRPAGTVDAIGDRGSAERFPTILTIDREERSFRWGTEASERVATSRLKADEVPILNLKTALREGIDRFTEHNPRWTNEELLGRYFERLLHRFDQYLRAQEPGQAVSRQSLDVLYVVCRPVLDANEGDEAGRRYEAALRNALGRCGVPATAVAFVLEPVAALTGLARSRPDFIAVAPGTAVAVIDSGGGTTDVAVARLRIDAGGIALEILGSYALQLKDGNPAEAALEYFHQKERQVGGNVLDWALAHRLILRADTLLESEGRPAPTTLWAAPPRKELAAARTREFILTCRRMKERFASASTQYLNRLPGIAPDTGEVLPFPHREDLQGVMLVHSLFDEQILTPILSPVAEAMSGEMTHRAAASEEAFPRPTQIQRVHFVGGTNIDPFVRRHLGRPFPMALREDDRSAQSPQRIRDRLNAVVEGAVWTGEPLFVSSPAAIELRLGADTHELVREGEPLLPSGAAEPRFVTCRLEPGEELSAELCRVVGGERRQVARAFYRNPSPRAAEVVLRVTLTGEEGCVGELQVGTERRSQWRLSLAGGDG